MINIRFDVACIPLYTCRTSEDFSSSCKACPEWPRCRSTERMQARNSVYESSRSAKCPRLGRANILPDRCQWWWGSEGRAPPEQWFQHFIERSQCRNHRRNRDEKKNDISVDIRIAIARPYVLPFRTRLVYLYEGQHDIDLPSTRCQTRRDWNVPIRPASQMSIRVKSYFPFSRPSHHPLWAWNLAMFFHIDLSLYIAVYIEIQSYAPFEK